jgi:hypothetical protein
MGSQVDDGGVMRAYLVLAMVLLFAAGANAATVPTVVSLPHFLNASTAAQAKIDAISVASSASRTYANMSTGLRTGSAAATAKPIPVSADRWNFFDSLTGGWRQLSWSNILSALGSVFQPIGTYLSSLTASGPIVVGGTATAPTLALGSVPFANQSTALRGRYDAAGAAAAVTTISGNAGTATALATNGTNCSAGQAALGVDASGNAEGCFTPTGTYILPSTGTAGTYTKVTTDAQGRVTSGTTLAATDLPAMTATVGGAVPTPPNDAAKFLNGAGTFTTPASGGSVIPGYINGFTLSNDATTPNTILDIAAGCAADLTNAAMITGTAFTKKTGGAWAAGTNANGMGTGLTITVSTWYHVFAIVKSGAFDIYFDTSAAAAHAPSGTTYFRRIGSFKTDGSSHILAFVQTGNQITWGTALQDLGGNSSTVAALFTLSVPTGVSVLPIGVITVYAITTPALVNVKLWSPVTGTSSALNALSLEQGMQDTNSSSMNQIEVTQYLPPIHLTNTSAQLYYMTSGQVYSYTSGWIDPHLASTW